MNIIESDNNFIKTKLSRRIATGFGMILLTYALCTMVGLVTLYSSGLLVVNILAGICNLAITVVMMGIFAYQYGKEDYHYLKKGDEIDKKVNIKMALIVSSPLYLMWILLVISKIVSTWNILPLYKLLHSMFKPFMDIISNSSDVALFPFWGILIVFVLIAIIPIAIYFFYGLGLKNVDIKKAIFYRK